jgi:hypothetical protein
VPKAPGGASTPSFPPKMDSGQRAGHKVCLSPSFSCTCNLIDWIPLLLGFLALVARIRSASGTPVATR